MSHAITPDGAYKGAPLFTVEGSPSDGFVVEMEVKDNDGASVPLCFFPEGFRFSDERLALRVRAALTLAFYAGPDEVDTTEANVLRQEIAHLVAANKRIHDDLVAEVVKLAVIAGVEPWTHKPAYPLNS